MIKADIERRIAYLEEKLARDDLEDWDRRNAEQALAENKELLKEQS